MLVDFIRLRRREEGRALVEYALILSLIAVVCITAHDHARWERQQHPDHDRERALRLGSRSGADPQRRLSRGGCFSEAGAGDAPPHPKEGARQVLEPRSLIFALASDEDGQALVEYSLIILLVALVTITALTSIGTSVSGIITTVANAL